MLIQRLSSDNERSLPHFMDGLKPSQRKVLFACFKRNLKQEIKVAQLAGRIRSVYIWTHIHIRVIYPFRKYRYQ